MSASSKSKGGKKAGPEPAPNIPGKSTLNDLVNIFKSLADAHRLKILLTLAHRGQLHVSAICEELDQSQPAVSHHLTQLKSAKLVDFDRKGKFNYYRLSSELLSDLIDHFFPNSSSAQQKVSFGDLELTFKKRVT